MRQRAQVDSLAEARRRFERWRKVRGGAGRIPAGKIRDHQGNASTIMLARTDGLFDDQKDGGSFARHDADSRRLPWHEYLPRAWRNAPGAEVDAIGVAEPADAKQEAFLAAISTPTSRPAAT